MTKVSTAANPGTKSYATLQPKQRECSKCMQMLNSVLTKRTRVSKLLSAMNANILSNEETGEIGILMDNSHGKKKAISRQLKTQERIPAHLTVATSPRADLNEVPQNIYSDSHGRPPPVQISCSWCGNNGAEGGARAYVKGPEPLSIVLCANRLASREEIHEVLIHELIHVYDVKFRGFDLRECTELAHSEIRAAREAECHNTNSLFRNLCIKTKATSATNNMFPFKGKQCVDQMFDIALKDLEPLNWSGKKNRRSDKKAVNRREDSVFVCSDK